MVLGPTSTMGQVQVLGQPLCAKKQKKHQKLGQSPLRTPDCWDHN